MALHTELPIWCDTCEGTGVVHQESQHGVPGSGGDFQCPDCDGRGFNERSYYTTPPAAPAQEPSQPEFFAKLDYDKDFNVLVSVYRRRADATPLLVHQEAWRLQEADKHDGFTGFTWKLASAIAASPSAAAREPLTDEQIAELYERTCHDVVDDNEWPSLRLFVKAVREFGITNGDEHDGS